MEKIAQAVPEARSFRRTLLMLGRNVQGNGPCRADFLLKGRGTSGYPFSNRRLLSE